MAAKPKLAFIQRLLGYVQRLCRVFTVGAKLDFLKAYLLWDAAFLWEYCLELLALISGILFLFAQDGIVRITNGDVRSVVLVLMYWFRAVHSVSLRTYVCRRWGCP